MIEIDNPGIRPETADHEPSRGGPESGALHEIPAAQQTDNEPGAIGVATSGRVHDGRGKGGNADLLDLAVFAPPGDAAPVRSHLEDGVADVAVEKEPDHVLPVVKPGDHPRLIQPGHEVVDVR